MFSLSTLYMCLFLVNILYILSSISVAFVRLDGKDISFKFKQPSSTFSKISFIDDGNNNLVNDSQSLKA